jgi:hypothetical protein
MADSRYAELRFCSTPLSTDAWILRHHMGGQRDPAAQGAVARIGEAKCFVWLSVDAIGHPKV